MNRSNEHALARHTGDLRAGQWRTAPGERSGPAVWNQRPARRSDAWPLWRTAVPVTIFCAAVWAGVFYMIFSL